MHIAAPSGVRVAKRRQHRDTHRGPSAPRRIFYLANQHQAGHRCCGPSSQQPSSPADPAEPHRHRHHHGRHQLHSARENQPLATIDTDVAESPFRSQLLWRDCLVCAALSATSDIEDGYRYCLNNRNYHSLCPTHLPMYNCMYIGPVLQNSGLRS
jgi:hypothetical protein